MDPDVQRELQSLAGPDPNRRTAALARLVALGPRATDDVIAALAAAPPGVRPLLAQALAEIADPRSAATLAQLLGDADPLVRGRAAQGLAALRDPLAIEALVRTINDLPDLLHHPYTVATYTLTALGAPALPAVLPLLRSDDLATRTRGWLVWREIVEKLPASGAWDALWRLMGSYAPDAPQAQREAAVRAWEAWLAAGP